MLRSGWSVNGPVVFERETQAAVLEREQLFDGGSQEWQNGSASWRSVLGIDPLLVGAGGA